MTKPITPAEVGASKAAALPPQVLEAFNELIALHYANGTSIVRQSDAADLVWEKLRPEHERLNLTARRMIFERGWMNVEEAYRAAGWHVEYNKPGFNEDYEATFTFTAPF